MYSFKMASHPTSSSSSSSVTSPTAKPVYRAVDIYLLVWLTRCMTIVFITVNVLFMVYLLNIKHDTDNSDDNTFSMNSHLDGTGSSRMMMSETSFATPFLTSSSASHPNRILTTTQTVTTTPDEDDSMKQSPHSQQQQQQHAIQISSPVIFLTDVVDVLPDERQEISRSESHAPPPPQYVRTSSQTTTSRRT